MYYSFDIDLATKYGVDEAILLYNLIFWLRKNKANDRNIHDGRAWTYNSANSLTEMFPFWNSRKIARLFLSLEEHGIIISSNYNKAPYDRTKWYALVDETLLDLPLDNMSNGLDKSANGTTQSVQPIPDQKTDQKPDKEKEIAYNSFLEAFNEATGRRVTVFGPKAKKQYNALLKSGHSQEDIISAAKSCSKNEFFQKKGNRKYLTPEYITRADKFTVYFDDQPDCKKTRRGIEVASV